MYKIAILLCIFLITAYLYGYLPLPRLTHSNRVGGPLGQNALKVVTSNEQTETGIAIAFENLKSSIEDLAEFEGSTSFLPPASNEEISSVENKIGYRIPAELRALWRITAGHKNGNLGFGWRLLSLEQASKWTSEQLSWSPPENGFPDLMIEGNKNKGWPPGFIIFASRDSDNVGIFVEDGKVYFQRPTEGHVLEANKLSDWLNNFANRIKNKEYKTDVFGNVILIEESIRTPGAFLNPHIRQVPTRRFFRFSLNSLLLVMLLACIAIHYSTSRISAKRSLAAVNNKSIPHWIDFQHSSLGKFMLSTGIGSMLESPKIDLGWIARVRVPHPHARKKTPKRSNN